MLRTVHSIDPCIACAIHMADTERRPHRSGEGVLTMRILVLGIGNILLSDEGIGVHVVRRLEEGYELPANVGVVDGETSGMDLLDMVAECDHLLIVDCARRCCQASILSAFLAMEPGPA